MKPPVRERYNAKARQSSAGSSHKKGKRVASATLHPHEELDPNADVHLPKSKDQKDVEKRDRMQQELVRPY